MTELLSSVTASPLLRRRLHDLALEVAWTRAPWPCWFRWQGVVEALKLLDSSRRLR